MTIWYEELKDGSIGINTPFKEVAEKLGLTNSTENEVILNWDGKYYIKGNCPEKPQELVNQERIVELEQYLKDTDWYAIRFADTGEEYPAEIREKRQEARDEISRLRG